MIISENKPMSEILGFLKNAEKVVLIGCNQCANNIKWFSELTKNRQTVE